MFIIIKCFYFVFFSNLEKDFNGIWGDLATCLEGFLFPNSRVPINTTFEEQQLDESLDVKVVHMIRDHILPFAGQMPKEFVLQAVSLLNKGSIHSATSNSPVGEHYDKNTCINKDDCVLCLFSDFL